MKFLRSSKISATFTSRCGSLLDTVIIYSNFIQPAHPSDQHRSSDTCLTGLAVVGAQREWVATQ